MKTPLSMIAALFAAFVATEINAETRATACSYALDPASIQINWTAFKTTGKVPVKGAFSEVTLVGELESKKGLTDLLSQLEGELHIQSEAMIRTGNPARDLTLFQHFFGLFKKNAEMTGVIHTVKGDEREGSFELKLTLNQKTREIPMHYRREASGAFEATGNLDVLDFGLSNAFQDLHHTCEALHMGKDGISKTWSQVVLKLEARIDEKCAP